MAGARAAMLCGYDDPLMDGFGGERMGRMQR